MQATGLKGLDVHGYSTLKDLTDLLEEGKGRWLDAREIYALLCNHNHFSITTHRLKSPTSGTIVFINGGQFRNFRNDGHNWKKPESHMDLMVQKKKRVRVYYAHTREGLDISRRPYWLLDENKRKVNDTVLVHYFKKQEKTGREEISGPVEDSTFQNHCQKIHDPNTREWDELVPPNDFNNSTAPIGDEFLVCDQSNRTAICGSKDEKSGANHNGMEEISESTGSGRNVQNCDQIPAYLDTSFWNESIFSNSTALTGGEDLVDNPTAVHDSQNDDGGSALSAVEHVFTDPDHFWDSPTL